MNKNSNLISLSTSRAREKAPSGLSSIRSRNPAKTSSSLFSVPIANDQQLCAYHVGEHITNFCKNKDCLLPLCPKCIKIHTEEHEKMGVHGVFETIEFCLNECIEQQGGKVDVMGELIKMAESMVTSHEQSLHQSKRQLCQAKQEMKAYIDEVFGFYESELERLTLDSSKNFESELFNFHQQVCSLMEKEKQELKKGQNKNMQMEYLIDCYSKKNVTELLDQYVQRIQEIAPTYVSLSTNTYELERLKVIVKKYLDFGDETNNKIHESLEGNERYSQLSLVQTKHTNLRPASFKEPTQVQSQYRSILNQRKLPIKKMGENKLPSQIGSLYAAGPRHLEFSIGRQSRLETFESPLSKFSLSQKQAS